MRRRFPSRQPIAAVTLVIALTAAGCGSDDPEPLDVAMSASLSVVATDMAFAPDEIVAAAGDVEVEMRNEGMVVHDLRIDRLPWLIEAGPGEVARGVVRLEPGRYRIWCSLPGHVEAGMEGALEVR